MVDNTCRDPRSLRIIKKYKNRRLYDTTKSQYINIDDLKQYVLDGCLFQVLDVASGMDLTNATLLQIVVEMQEQTTPFLSSDVLRQLIVMMHHPMHEVFKTMMAPMMSAILEQNKVTAVWQKQFDAWQKLF